MSTRTLTPGDLAVLAAARDVAAEHGVVVDGGRLVDRWGQTFPVGKWAEIVAVRLGYSDDQPRDELGRFGEGSGGGRGEGTDRDGSPAAPREALARNLMRWSAKHPANTAYRAVSPAEVESGTLGGQRGEVWVDRRPRDRYLDSDEIVLAIRYEPGDVIGSNGAGGGLKLRPLPASRVIDRFDPRARLGYSDDQDRDEAGRFSGPGGGGGAMENATGEEPPRVDEGQGQLEGLESPPPDSPEGRRVELAETADPDVADYMEREYDSGGYAGGSSESEWFVDPISEDRYLVKSGSIGEHEGTNELVAAAMVEELDLVGSPSVRLAADDDDYGNGNFSVAIAAIENRDDVDDFDVVAGIGRDAIDWDDEQVVRDGVALAMFDQVVQNQDGHGGNIGVATMTDGGQRLVALDNSLILGGRGPDHEYSEGFPDPAPMSDFGQYNDSRQSLVADAASARYARGGNGHDPVVVAAAYDATVQNMDRAVDRVADPAWQEQLPPYERETVAANVDYMRAQVDGLREYRDENVQWLSTGRTMTEAERDAKIQRAIEVDEARNRAAIEQVQRNVDAINAMQPPANTDEAEQNRQLAGDLAR